MEDHENGMGILEKEEISGNKLKTPTHPFGENDHLIFRKVGDLLMTKRPPQKG